MAYPGYLLENGHQAVTYVFVNMAMVANDNIGHQGKIVIQGLSHFLEISIRRVGRKIHDVRHQDGEHLTLPTEEKRPRPHVLPINPAEGTLHRLFGVKAFE